jgi:uncharacterized membrane protein
MAKFFNPDDEARIVAAIREAENNTSGEIRVHVAKRCPGDPVEAAEAIFDKLKMYCTEARNGVLFYIATEDRKFAIIGDEGIDKATPDDFWQSTVNATTCKFSEGAFADGLVGAITEAGNALRTHFPHQADDINELTDEINYDA